MEELFQKLGLEVPTEEIPEVTFDFEGLLDSEILHKTIEQDEIARDLYVKIFESTDPEIIIALFGSENIKFFC